MRRLVLVFMMVLLPLQWSWAAAASVCAHESGQSHFGHHEHKHTVAPEEAGHDHSGELPGKHPDCQVCHGIGAAFMAFAGKSPVTLEAQRVRTAYGGVLPEPPLENLLRPPMSFVA